MASIESRFIKENVSRLLSRFGLRYYQECDCIEYFITSKETAEEISYSIVLSLNTRSKEIHVSRFCPELYREIDSKYLSAACFYLVIHHFGHIYHLDDRYCICLETPPATYDRFFSRLRDFHLRNEGLRLCGNLVVVGAYPPLAVNTSMIEKRSLRSEIMPFQV